MPEYARTFYVTDAIMRRQTTFKDCAQLSPGIDGRDASPVAGGDLGGGRSRPSSHICFKCGGANVLPFHKSAPHLSAKLYLCPSCVKPRKSHPENVEFDCGCTEDRTAGENAKHWLPPNPTCAACRGTGKIRDRHVCLGKKSTVGATDSERGRHAHTAHRDEPNPIHVYYPNGGWQVRSQDYWREPTYAQPGRPLSTIHKREVVELYMVDVANEVAEEYRWILELDGADFAEALSAVTAIMFARSKSANPRELEKWLPISKATIYRKRKQGMLLQQLERIENHLQHQTAVDELRWAELFRRFGPVEEDEFSAEDQEPETKP